LRKHSFLANGSNLNTADEMRKGIISGAPTSERSEEVMSFQDLAMRGACVALIVPGLLLVLGCAGPPPGTPEPTPGPPAPTVEGQVQFSTGCNDIIDVSVLPQDKKIEECKRVISFKSADLEQMGFGVEDCQVVDVEARDCQPALGTELMCTYACGEE
jgi:hypothetical protein